MTYTELLDWQFYFTDHLFSDDAADMRNALNIYYQLASHVDSDKAKNLKVEDFLINKPNKQNKPQTGEDHYEMINSVITDFNRRRKE